MDPKQKLWADYEAKAGREQLIQGAQLNDDTYRSFRSMLEAKDAGNHVKIQELIVNNQARAFELCLRCGNRPMLLFSHLPSFSVI